MTDKVKAIPDGYQGATPYLCVRGAAAAIDFYTAVFGAIELYRMGDPGGGIGHAEMKLGEGIIMLSDEHPEMGVLSPQSIGGSPVSLLIYVEDVDTVFAQAITAGATQDRPVEDKFYGDRGGSLVDPFGHIWHIATHTEDLSPEEMEKRGAAAGGQ